MTIVILHGPSGKYFYTVNKKLLQTKKHLIMKQGLIRKNGRSGLLVFFLLFASVASFSQSRYTSSLVDLTVSGTSTLHDWTMKNAKADCSADITVGSTGQITGVDNLQFSTPVRSLKSEHSGMDNNAYKALKTDKNPDISFTVTSVTIASAQAGGSTVTCKGKLAIAGTSREAEVVALCKLSADNTIDVSGTEKISMKDFSIAPPTFMMGTIKTGNDVVLTFHLTLKKS